MRLMQFTKLFSAYLHLPRPSLRFDLGSDKALFQSSFSSQPLPRPPLRFGLGCDKSLRWSSGRSHQVKKFCASASLRLCVFFCYLLISPSTQASQPPPEWQRSIEQYNQGTLYLTQEKWTEALHWFKAAISSNPSSPFLLRNLYLNSGIAYQRLAESLQQRYPEEMTVPLHLANLSLKTLQEGEEIDCTLSKLLFQNNLCASDLPWNTLKQEAELRIAQWEKAQKQQSNQVLHHASSQQLSSAIDQARSTLVLSLTGSPLEEIRKAQSDTLASVQPFLNAVREEQQSQFQKGLCQNAPWDQSIPLFASGVQAAKESEKLLELNERRWPEIMAWQEQTLILWIKALRAQESKSKQQQEQPQPQATQFKELQRRIVEMEGEDKPKPPPAQQEWHTW